MIDSSVYEIPNSPSEYAEGVHSGVWVPSGLVPPPAEVASAALCLLHGRFRRKRAIKRMFEALTAAQYIPEGCELKFKLYDRRVAYMTDGGGAVFSLSSICRGSGAFTLKLVLHEVAHLWLSKKPCYPKLKALQKGVRAEFGSAVPGEFLPIEYYAVSLSVKMLECILPIANKGDKAHIQAQIDCEKSKLTSLSLSQKETKENI